MLERVAARERPRGERMCFTAKRCGVLSEQGHEPFVGILVDDDQLEAAIGLSLEMLHAVFAHNAKLDGLTGRPLDRSFSRYHTTSGPIGKLNVFLRCTSFAIFLRNRVVQAVGQFDEGLGLGTDTGRIAAEESDYLIRALAAGARLEFHADITVFHQEPNAMYDSAFNHKARGYNIALGYVLRKHRYPFWYVLRTWVRALGGITVSRLTLNIVKARYHAKVLQGRVLGYFGSA